MVHSIYPRFYIALIFGVEGGPVPTDVNPCNAVLSPALGTHQFCLFPIDVPISVRLSMNLQQSYLRHFCPGLKFFASLSSLFLYYIPAQLQFLRNILESTYLPSAQCTQLIFFDLFLHLADWYWILQRYHHLLIKDLSHLYLQKIWDKTNLLKPQA